ncbi:MAG: efflux RND transporter periplasmic adaptor subunit [Balneolaceae bacterium]
MFTKNNFIAATTFIALAATIYAVMTFNAENGTVIQVQTVTASLGEVVSTVTATGTLEPINQVEVGTQVSGEIEKIYVDYNSIVSSGQLIAELDKTTLKAKVTQAKANLQKSQNEQTYREAIFNRKKSLYEQKLITDEEYELAVYNYNSAKIDVTQSESDLEEAETNLGYADIYSPISGVVLSREVDEGQTVAASMSTPTLFNIAEDLKKMQVEADVDEADIGQVMEGQRVSFTVDSYQGEEFDGTVTQVRLNPTTTSNVVTYTVVVNAANDDQKLKPGMTATITIYTQELTNVLTLQVKALSFTSDQTILENYYNQEGIKFSEEIVPNSDGERPERGSNKEDRPARPSGSLSQDGPPAGVPPRGEGFPGEDQDLESAESSLVFVKTAEGLIIPRPVETGANDGINVEIISGLEEGDEVVYRIIETEIVTEDKADEEARSPFMPTPPGRK